MTPRRPEYRQLARDFLWHAQALGWTPDGVAVDDMGRFLAAMEGIDDHLDGLSSRDGRRRFSKLVVRRLETGRGGLPAGLGAPLDALAHTLRRRGTCTPFVVHAREAFEVTEELRTVRRLGRYLHLIRREGHLTAHLVLIAISPAPAALVRVFEQLGAVGNHVDELRDLNADHRGGLRVIGRGWWVRLALLVDLLRGALPLLASHPRPIGVLARGGAHMLQ